MNHYRANGKLLITGEYAVLDGALALALPAKLGQTLVFEPGGPHLNWQSYDADGGCWFEAVLHAEDFSVRTCSNPMAGVRLVQILSAARQLQPQFQPVGNVSTWLEFSRHWGLGTSSTLIADVASWAEVDAFELLEMTFGGSGYDVACASAGGPLLFQRREGKPHFVEIPFAPPFAEHLFFVYLGRKQDSREGIQRYRERAASAGDAWLNAISRITLACAAAVQLPEFESLLSEHERLVGRMLGLPPVQSALFSDYWGTVKSLGAWGGDFVLATSNRSTEETLAYFHKKGLDTVLRYGDLIL